MKLTAQINSKSNLESVLSAIMDASKTIMEAEASSLLIVDEETKELVLTTPTGPATAELSNKRFPLDFGIAGWVIKNNETAIVSDVKNDDRFGGDIREELFQTRNVICVPMRDQNEKVIGALQAINTDFVNDQTSGVLLAFEAMANQAAIAITNAHLQKRRVQQELIMQELNLAHSIQSGFWPKETPEITKYNAAGISIPASQVGGDYYDFIPVPNSNKIGLVVADVSGKGMAAALLMATVRSVIRAQVENNHSPSEIIARVNNAIHRDTPADKFITMFYGELDPDNHTFEYVNAGHNPPYLVDHTTKKLTPLEEGGLMLGVMKNMSYDCKKISISPKQQLVIFTDGVTEAQNSKKEFLEEDGLEKWILNKPGLSSEELLNQMKTLVFNFQGDEPQFDDITAIVITRE